MFQLCAVGVHARNRLSSWNGRLLSCRRSRQPLEGLFGLIAAPVLKPETAPDGQQTLREIGILLGDVLDLLEEDQAILQTADELYEAAFGLHP